jgi:ATP-dependent DNA helicase RecG
MEFDLSTDIGLLRQILELEHKKGYPDSAVIGGLDKFLFSWSDRVIDSFNHSGLQKRFTSIFPPQPVYALMNKVQRRAWISEILKLLDELEHSDLHNNYSNDNTIQNIEKKKKVVPAEVKPQKSKVKAKSISKMDTDLQLLESSILMVKGINEALRKKFEKLGVKTIRELLFYFPNRHIDYSQRAFINNLIVGQENTIIANVWEAREVLLGTRRSTEVTAGDETGNIRIVWFNQPYLARSLKTGDRVVISGRVTQFGGMPVFESPEWEPYEDKDLVHTGRLVPVYPLTQGLSQRQVRRIMKPAIDTWARQLDDYLPKALRSRLRLLDLPEAVIQAHYPEDETKKDEARKRLAFDELFILQLGVLNKKRLRQDSQPGIPLKTNHPELKTFIDSLPYQLTTGQKKALRDILTDLQKPKPMSRLLQGEVGSGKTVVAAAALILAVAEGFQGALMAPTEILAEQHLNTLRQILSMVGKEDNEGSIYRYTGFLNKPLTIVLLIGDISQTKKQIIQEKISSGEIDLIVGTHALIQKGLNFNKLGLIVVDEQHRFGVEQRSAMRQKGVNPHVLVMTATPIPRTLALTLYGDLDLSVIDELPPGRQIIKTKWLKSEQRGSGYGFLNQQVKQGRQAFIICPLVEESDSIQAKAAIAEYERLSREIFPHLRLGLLHGRMSSENKEAVMQQFKSGELDILVSTPVIEVGIDVPNATVMLIESADRFGLSQLHQFRGRVGRGKEQSYCMLLAEKPSDIGKERLDLIERIHNGFVLAEEDLKLRGPGEFFGTRQSGLPDLKMAKLSDVSILELARKEATRLFQIDPVLQQPEHLLLAAEVAKVWRDSSAEWS